MAIYIPVRGIDELAVEVPSDDLPHDATDVLNILKAELAPLNLWLRFAIEYYKQGNIDAFKLVLEEGTDPSLEQYYGEAKSERISILNAQAAYYIQQARLEKDRQKKEEYFGKATSSYNTADKINFGDETAVVGKGVLLLARGEHGRANQNFDTVLESNRNNTPALLGKAAILYNKNNFEEALKLYKQALKTNPTSPANVRLGLAYCYNRLGRVDLAKKAFERVLSLEPENIEALLGYAIIELNGGDNAEWVYSLSKAYEINNQHPNLLNNLSKYLFYKGDYSKAQTLARIAMTSTEVDQIKAESSYLLGRIYQAQVNYSTAFNHYNEAVRLWPEYALAQFGLGQMYIYKDDIEKAISCFEVVLHQYPDNVDTLKVLGSLYTTSNRKEKALAMLKRVTELKPKDNENWIELAQLTEQTAPADSLKAYERAIKILKNNQGKIPSELYNNIGALHHQLHQYDEAEVNYKNALEEEGASESNFSSAQITIVYNLARTYEEQKKISEAESLYDQILKVDPNYSDCYLRLGCLANERKQTKEATNFWLSDTISNSAEALTLLGNSCMEKEQWQQAQKQFEAILATNKHDVYSLICLGNIFYYCLTPSEKKDKVEKCLKLATEYYLKSLQLDPTNIFAANGLGMMMAEKGYIDQAKEIFIQVREATADVPDIWTNLAHIYFSQGHFFDAINMYQNCLKRFGKTHDVNIMLFLSRAYFEAGMLPECKSTLQNALITSPDNTLLQYNVALTNHESATQLLKKDKRKVSSTEIQSTIAEVKQAAEQFKNLAENKREPRHYSTSRAAGFEKACGRLLATLNERLAEAQDIEQQEQERKKRERDYFSEVERKKREAEEAEKKKKEDEERRLQEIAKAKLEEFEEQKAQWIEESRQKEQKEKEKSSGPKRKRDSILLKDDDNEDDEDEPEPEPEREREEVRKKKRDNPEPAAAPMSAEAWREDRDRKNPRGKDLANRKIQREEEEKESRKKRRDIPEEEKNRTPEPEPEPESGDEFNELFDE